MPEESLPLPDPTEQATPTIRDVAKAAGVSIASVSRALNAHRECAPETRDRILSIAREIGYHRNAAASILGATGKRGRTQLRPTVGFITLPPEHRAKETNRTNRLTFENAGAVLGLQTETQPIAGLEELPKALRTMHARGCEGLLLDMRTTEPYWKVKADWDRFAIVTLDSEHPGSPFHQVRRTHFDDLSHTWEVLVRRGYKRIGAAINEHPYPEASDRQRIGAILSSQDAHPELEAIPPLREPFGARSGKFKGWFEQHQPDAVVGFGINTWWDLLHLDKRMPRDVGLTLLHGGGAQLKEKRVGITNIMTGFDLKNSVIFEAAIQMLGSLLIRRQRGIPNHRTLLEVNGRWFEGNSLRKTAG